MPNSLPTPSSSPPFPGLSMLVLDRRVQFGKVHEDILVNIPCTCTPGQGTLPCNTCFLRKDLNILSTDGIDAAQSYKNHHQPQQTSIGTGWAKVVEFTSTAQWTFPNYVPMVDWKAVWSNLQREHGDMYSEKTFQTSLCDAMHRLQIEKITEGEMNLSFFRENPVSNSQTSTPPKEKTNRMLKPTAKPSVPGPTTRGNNGEQNNRDEEAREILACVERQNELIRKINGGNEKRYISSHSLPRVALHSPEEESTALEANAASNIGTNQNDSKKQTASKSQFKVQELVAEDMNEKYQHEKTTHLPGVVALAKKEHKNPDLQPDLSLTEPPAHYPGFYQPCPDPKAQTQDLETLTRIYFYQNLVAAGELDPTKYYLADDAQILPYPSSEMKLDSRDSMNSVDSVDHKKCGCDWGNVCVKCNKDPEFEFDVFADCD